MRLGRYLVERLLGSGGMGEVYLATDTELQRRVALKLLPSDLSGDPGRRARLLQEARLCASLSHPHVATVYEVFEQDGRIVLSMEYVDGESIRRMLAAGPVPVNRLLRMASQAADALAAAHRRGIVHRDIKPDNVMVTADGVTKILDFGLARPVETLSILSPPIDASHDGTESLTAPGVVMGTPSYMAPEQVHGHPATPESDIFSLGATLYEASTGRKPFAGASPAEIMAAILRDEPIPPSRLNPDLPPELDRIVARAMAKDPTDRYHDARDLASDVRDLRRRLESGGTVTAEGPAVPVMRRRTLYAVSAVVAAGLIAMAGWSWFGRRGEVPPPAAKLRRLVVSEGLASDPALSPDGTMIAYVLQENGRADLYLARTAGGGRVRLTDDTAREMRPTFSPDGERIAFVRWNVATSTYDVWMIPALGGGASLVMKGASTPAFSPDGKRLALIRWTPDSRALVTTAADGTDERVLSRSDADFPFLRRPAWSPDGRTIAFERLRGGIGSEIWAIPAMGGTTRRLIADPPGVFSREPVFSPDGKSIVHVSNRGGATNLWSVPLAGGKPAQLTSGPGPDDLPTVGRDGRIAFVNSRLRAVIDVVDRASGTVRALVRHPGVLWSPAFAPDGRSLAYTRAEEDGAWHLWVAPLDGGPPHRLTEGKLPEIYPRFTPDGRSIVYQTWSREPDRIWKIDVDGGTPIALTPERDDDDAYADVSPDGKLVAFTRTEQGVDRICVMPLAGGPATKIHEGPATIARWSPDGSWIAFARHRGYDGGIFVMRPDGTMERRLTGVGGWPVWLPDGRSIAFQALDPYGDSEIRVVRLAGGPATPMPAVPFVGANNPFDFSKDGKELAAVTSEVLGSEIWVRE